MTPFLIGFLGSIVFCGGIVFGIRHGIKRRTYRRSLATSIRNDLRALESGSVPPPLEMSLPKGYEKKRFSDRQIEQMEEEYNKIYQDRIKKVKNRKQLDSKLRGIDDYRNTRTEVVQSFEEEGKE